MDGADHEEFGAGEDVLHEAVPGCDAPGKFGGGVHHRVDFALQDGLRRVQCLDGVAKTAVADEQQIDVAAGVFVAPCQRAEDQSQFGRRLQGAQRLGQYVDEAAGLAEQAGQFGEYRAFAVGLVANLIALFFAQQQANFGQPGQFPVQGAGGGVGQACQFADVVAALGVQKQLRQRPLPIGAEE